jgi:NADH dehydrogenase/NADH:ubiquinone oxidoreductase subunit G
LNEKLEQQGRGFAAIVDTSGQIQANTAPTTALAIIQEAMISTSALMGRVIDSMSDEFQILFDLDKRVFDPELYKVILDDEKASSVSDFNNESLDIVPTASPEMSSKMQRMQLSLAEMEQIPSVIQAGGNPTPIVKNFYERIGSDNVDEIFPEKPTDAQAEEMARFTEVQQQQNALAEQQLETSRLQTEILGREQDRLDAETKMKIQETIGKLEKMRSESILNLEKAETEETKNQISAYTAELNGTISMLTAIGADDVRRANNRDKVTAQQAANITGGVQ